MSSSPTPEDNEAAIQAEMETAERPALVVGKVVGKKLSTVQEKGHYRKQFILDTRTCDSAFF